jgi:hypothetical protein
MDRGDRKRGWCAPAALVFTLFFAAFTICGRGRVITLDALGMLAVTKSIVDEGSVAVSPSFAAAGAVPGRGGRYYVQWGIGKSLANVPFYLAAKAFAAAVPRFPQEHVTHLFVSQLNPILTALTCACLFRFCLFLTLTPRQALGLAALYGFGTIAFVYAKDDMSEPLAALLILAGIYAAILHARSGRVGWALASALALGGAVATRYVLAYVPALVGLYLLGNRLAPAGGRRRTSSASLALYFGVLGAFALALAYYNYVRFGSVGETGYDKVGYGIGAFSFFSARFLEQLVALLVSPGRGLFFYMPFLVVSVLGVRPFLRAHGREAVLLGATALGSLVLVAGYDIYDGGPWSWGPRFLIPVLPLLMPVVGYGLRHTLVHTRPGFLAVALLITASVLIQAPAVVAPWVRYIVEVGVKGEHGEAVDYVWGLSDSQPVQQPRVAYEVLSKSDAERRATRPESWKESWSGEQHLKHSRGLNLPDLWFVRLYYEGISRAALAAALGSLAVLLALSARALLSRPEFRPGRPGPTPAPEPAAAHVPG